MKLIDIIKNSRSFSHYFVNEGLIKSTSMPDTYMLLMKHGFVVQPNEDEGPYALGKYVSTLTVLVDNKEKYEKIKSILNVAGWYFSAATDIRGQEITANPAKLNNLPEQVINAQVVFLIEPKYDVEFDWDALKKDVTKLYHATPSIFWKKIQNIGLVPKSIEKKSWHPERIYLTISPQVAVDIAQELSKYSKYSEYVILEIDLNKLSYSPRIFSDPNFSGLGVYILTNIPPKAITLHKQVSA